MSRTHAIVAASVGGALVLVGLVFGLLPVSTGYASCGSAFISDPGALGCRRALSSYRTTALVFLGAGALVLLFANGIRVAVKDRGRRP